MSDDGPPSLRKTPRKRGSREDPGDKKSALTPDDLAALDAFCEGIEFEDIAFETWSQVHHSLDLTITLKLTHDEAASGGEKELVFCRTRARKKEQVSYKVAWSAKSKSGTKIVYKAEGDSLGEQCGDLVVVVAVR